MTGFKLFVNESIQANNGQLPFLKAILDDAKDVGNVLIFADFLEENSNLLGGYLRTKIYKKDLPKELIPLDNYFFQGIRQHLNNDSSWYERVISIWNPRDDVDILAGLTDRKFRAFWEPILNSKTYFIEGHKVAEQSNSFNAQYSPTKSLFFASNHGEGPMWIAIDNPSIELHWLMMVNALYLEKVI